jgi:hypothetical protein
LGGGRNRSTDFATKINCTLQQFEVGGLVAPHVVLDANVEMTTALESMPRQVMVEDVATQDADGPGHYAVTE